VYKGYVLHQRQNGRIEIRTKEHKVLYESDYELKHDTNIALNYAKSIVDEIRKGIYEI